MARVEGERGPPVKLSELFFLLAFFFQCIVEKSAPRVAASSLERLLSFARAGILYRLGSFPGFDFAFNGSQSAPEASISRASSPFLLSTLDSTIF